MNGKKADPAPLSPKGEDQHTESSKDSNDINPEMHFGANPSTFRNAEFLRANETLTEKLLWEKIRRNALGVKFRRQHPLGNFIADFYCHKAKLVIEIDGKYHEKSMQKNLDSLRVEDIVKLGLQVIRFTDNEVINNIDSVISEIINTIQRRVPEGD